MPTKRRIESKAPTRIDLAGGTVDIWPLYLFLNRATTVNLGIDLFAEAKLEESSAAKGQGRVVLKSEDQGHEMNLSWDELEGADPHPALSLHLKLLRFFAHERKKGGHDDRDTNLTLSTVARSPAGAGLGGSSTLSIAIVGSLATWARGSIDAARDGERFIEIVRDTETTVIQVPAGMQDYYGAMFGGLQSLRWGAGAHERQWLPTQILSELEGRLLLFYSGQSRNSGINNWALFKAFIDKQGEVRSKFQSIVDATHRLEAALWKGEWAEAGQAIASEWEVRRTLAQGITTPEIDQAFKAALSEGASAGKICGAGGGGCFFVYVPTGDAATKKRIVEKVTAQGIRHLPFKAVPHGLEVKVTRA
jgi:D-glycero-alpha-D-manno-heptose-7-phosphate kinase